VNSKLIKQSLMAATLITIGGNILGRLFGFGREAVIAGYFGTSAILDTFILAFTLPELLGMVFFYALPVALIPSLGASTDDERRRESGLFWLGLGWFALSFGVISILILLLREQVLMLLAPKLTPEDMATGSRLLAILSFYVFFRGMEAYFRGWCFVRKHFVTPATSNIIINVTVMASVILLYGRLHVETLAWGWLTGAALLMTCNGIFAFRLIRPSRPTVSDNVWMKTLLRTLIGVGVLESISMAYPLIDRAFAAEQLGPGPISALRYASTLISLPTGIFVAAFNIAAFPWISDYSGGGQQEKLRHLYGQSTRLLIFFVGLVAVGVAIFANDIVRVSLQRGQFDASSLMLTSGPLALFAYGMVFQAVYTFQMRFYYVRKMLFRLGSILAVMLAAKILLSWLLIGPMKHEGLALATSAACVLGFAVMTIDLARHMDVRIREILGMFAVKTLVCLSLVALAWLGAGRLWPGADYSLTGSFFRLVVLGVLGIAAYLGLGRWFGMSEPTKALDLVTSRFKK
jgi:putative peptidoglycan lipid II flippase